MTSQKRFIYLTSINTTTSCIGISLRKGFSSYCHKLKPDCSQGFCPTMAYLLCESICKYRRGSAYPVPTTLGSPPFSEVGSSQKSKKKSLQTLSLRWACLYCGDDTCYRMLKRREWEPGWPGHFLNVKTKMPPIFFPNKLQNPHSSRAGLY